MQEARTTVRQHFTHLAVYNGYCNVTSDYTETNAAIRKVLVDMKAIETEQRRVEYTV